jgi:hypothetical protein
LNVEKLDKKSLQELIQSAPQPEWLRRMREYHLRTGGYRPSDLAKLLGDQTRGVEVGDKQSVLSQLQNVRTK